MPRLTKSLPKYCKHKASGQAVVTLDGKDFYLGSYGTKVSQCEYDRLVGLWQANGRQLAFQDGDCFTVVELCVEYWNFAQTYYVKNGKPTDELSGLKIALRFLRKLHGNEPVSQFGPIALIAVQNAFIAEGHCRRYVNQNVGRIKRMFKWGVSRELVPVGIYQALATLAGLRKGKTIARESRPVLPVDDKDVDQTIAYMSNRTTADMVRIQRLTGCRPGELYLMKPGLIDCSGSLHEGVWMFHPETHKMDHRNRDRTILVGPSAQKILAKYLHREPDQCCFVRRDGKPYTRSSYSNQIRRACERANVDCWAPNRLRHSAATEIRGKFGLEASQTVLGHSSANVTQIYAERDIAMAAKIIAQVG